MERLWLSPDTNFGGKGIQVGESLSLSKINVLCLDPEDLTQGGISEASFPRNIQDPPQVTQNLKACVYLSTENGSNVQWMA